MEIGHCVKLNSRSMVLINCSCPIFKANWGWWVTGQHTWARLAVHVKDTIDRFELTNGCSLGITTDNASSYYSITPKLQSSLEASAKKGPALRNHIPCMAHVIQLALGAFMSSLGVKGRTKSWEAHERNQQFVDNESIEIGKSQRLRKEGNTRIDKVSAMKPGLATIIELVRIPWYFESLEIDFHLGEDPCGIDYTDTWSSKRVHWLSTSQGSHCGTTDYGCEDTLELITRVARSHIPITGIHTRVSPKSNIHWWMVTFHNSRCMDHCEICHGSIEAISIFDTLDVKEANSHIASRYHRVQLHVRSHGGRDANFC